MVEFAIALPVFLIVVCAVIEFSLILSNQVQLSNATRDAVRAAAIHFESAPVPIPDADRVSQAQAAGTSDASSLISCAAGTPSVTAHTSGYTPQTVTVSMSCTYTPVTPLGKLVTLFGGAVNLPTSITSSSTRYVEP
jgi:Flp pilus assembly protein TadG